MIICAQSEVLHWLKTELKLKSGQSHSITAETQIVPQTTQRSPPPPLAGNICQRRLAHSGSWVILCDYIIGIKWFNSPVSVSNWFGIGTTWTCRLTRRVRLSGQFPASAPTLTTLVTWHLLAQLFPLCWFPSTKERQHILGTQRPFNHICLFLLPNSVIWIQVC